MSDDTNTPPPFAVMGLLPLARRHGNEPVCEPSSGNVGHMPFGRSMLFVPAHDERRVPKALASAADAVILDLEDAVPAAEKAHARSRLAGAIGAHPRGLVRVNAVGTDDFPAHARGSPRRELVPVNAFGTDDFAADWAAVRALDVAGAVLPKASSAEEVPE